MTVKPTASVSSCRCPRMQPGRPQRPGEPQSCGQTESRAGCPACPRHAVPPQIRRRPSSRHLDRWLPMDPPSGSRLLQRRAQALLTVTFSAKLPPNIQAAKKRPRAEQRCGGQRENLASAPPPPSEGSPLPPPPPRSAPGPPAVAEGGVGVARPRPRRPRRSLGGPDAPMVALTLPRWP